MRIRFLLMSAYGVGGTVRTTLDTASRLVDRGHDVEVASCFGSASPPAFPVDPRVRVVDLTRSSPLARLRPDQHQGSRTFHPRDNRYPLFSRRTDRAMARWLGGLDADVVVGTRPGLNLLLARAAPPSVAVVAQEHLPRDSRDPVLVDSCKRYYRGLDLMTALTPDDVASWSELVDGSTPVRWMPNAVTDVGDHRADLDSKLVVTAGRLAPQKNFAKLIRAFALVRRRHPDWQLKIYGDGPRRPGLQEVIDRLGVGAGVRLMGRTDQVPQRLAEGSIFAMSSRVEGLPMVLLEAIGVGLAPVSFDCPHGPRAVIDHGVDGLLVPPGDVEGLAAGICALIEDPARRHAIGAAALVKAERFSGDAVSALWDDLLEEVTASRSPDRRPAHPGPVDWPDVPPAKPRAGPTRSR